MRHISSPAPHSAAAGSRHHRGGFTLVELLVVIGIIALLIGILLPSLHKARVVAQRAVCLSQMHQITLACAMWTNEHRGYMPARSGSSFYQFVTTVNNVTTLFSGGTLSAISIKNPSTMSVTDMANWIAYQRYTDAFGATNHSDDENSTYSGIAPYLGGKEILSIHGGSSTLPDSGQVGAGLDKLFRCPADNLASRPNQIASTNPAWYRFSYSMNDFVAYGQHLKAYKGGDGVTYAPGQRSDFIFSGKLSSIKHPASVIMLVCEDETSLDDGVFSPNPWQWDSTQFGVNLVASRHDSGYNINSGRSYSNLTAQIKDARGNVTFCDGHGEVLSRKDALRQKYTSSPARDPTAAEVPGFN